MKQQKYGRIINFSSPSHAPAMLGIMGQAHYAAAKGGVASLTYATALEMGRYGVTCNAVTPGARTRMAKEVEEKGIKAGFVPEKAVGLLGASPDPSLIAPFVAYLSSDAASKVNGHMFFVAGPVIGIWDYPRVVKQVSRDLKQEGIWTFEEIERLVPEKLLANPF